MPETIVGIKDVAAAFSSKIAYSKVFYHDYFEASLLNQCAIFGKVRSVSSEICTSLLIKFS